MNCVSRRPMNFQVRPPSVDLNMPAPGEMELREFTSPVPTYTTLVSEGAMAMSFAANTPVRSKIGVQVMPAFTVFQTPPVAKAT